MVAVFFGFQASTLLIREKLEEGDDDGYGVSELLEEEEVVPNYHIDP